MTKLFTMLVFRKNKNSNKIIRYDLSSNNYKLLYYWISLNDLRYQILKYWNLIIMILLVIIIIGLIKNELSWKKI